MVEQVVTQHKFNAEIESIGKPFNGGDGWDIVLDWKLPGSNYPQHVGGRDWDEIEGFQVGQTRDWVLNRGNIKRDKTGQYASDYFWNWDKSGNSKPPVAVAPPAAEADEFFTGKPDTPSGSTRSNAPAEDTDTKIRRGACFNKAVDLYNAERDISTPIDYTRIAEITHGLYHNVSQIPMHPAGYCWLHGTGRNASTQGLYHKIEGEDRWCMESGIVDVDVDVEATGLVEEAKKLGAEASLEKMANEPAEAPAAAAAHYCERHQVEYIRHDKDRPEPLYAHRWGENRHWCIEGQDSLLDDKGEPVTEATML